jgi:hypothetical protein
MKEGKLGPKTLRLQRINKPMKCEASTEIWSLSGKRNSSRELISEYKEVGQNEMFV